MGVITVITRHGLSISGDFAPLWVAVTWELHCITKGMLLIKETGKRKQIGPQDWQELRDELIGAHETWLPERLEWLRSVDVKTINRYLRPESRRMVDEIWLDLSVKFGKPVDELQAVVLRGE